MELCKDVLNGLTIAGNISVISDKTYSNILAQVFSVFSSDKPPSTVSDQIAEVKIAEGALLTFLLEAAKHDCDANLVSSVLEDCKMIGSRASQFVQKYQENKLMVQSMLSKIGRHADHIVDVKWRQDLIIKMSNCDKIEEQNYVVSLKTLNSHTNQIGDVTFGCTLEQLQDLVNKLKDAAKSIERAATH